MVGKSCLLVVPQALHFYPGLLKDQLSRLGYAVTTANDEYPANPLGKVLGKLDSPVSRWWTRRVFQSRYLGDRRWDLVVILKGRGVGAPLVHDMKRTGARVVGYHYDALAYDRGARRWSPSVDRVSTFDYRDAAEQGWPLVQLFAANRPSPGAGRRYRLSAVLRNHSDRLWFLDRILPEIGPGDTFVYIYEKGLLTLLHNIFRNPSAYWRWRKSIHFKPLDYRVFEEVLASSEYTLDYAHPAQTGATMRSVEALAAGARLITNNTYVADDPIFAGSPVVVCTKATPVGDVGEQMRRADSRPAVRRQRTPAEFLSEVIGETPPP